MARRRRHHRRRNPLNPINKGDWTPIIIGALGGAAAIYLYLKPQLQSASPTQTVSLTTPTLPGSTTTTTTPTG